VPPTIAGSNPAPLTNIDSPPHLIARYIFDAVKVYTEQNETYLKP